ncbi:MAG: GspH/FimT family pseudopilin [Gammaproteobacteria bacterium]|nr:MAG: GspH/FimT family pseudopilin [Gammaproteobacteria bacterium]
MGKKLQEGFTLIELLVLMMVLAITLGLGVPAFNGMRANNRMSAAANDLVTSLHAARSEALTRSRSVTMCASGDWDAARPVCDGAADLPGGWIVFVDENTNGGVDDGELVVQGHGPMDGSIRDQARTRSDGAGPVYLSFRADGILQAIPGLPDPVSNIQLCDARGNKDTGGGTAAGRWITVSPAGRPALHDTVAALQDDRNPLAGCGAG